MKPPSALMLALLLSGCAVGVVRPDRIEGAALGQAGLETCVRGADDAETAMCVETRETCLRLHGGALSLGAAEMAGDVIGGLFAWLIP